MKATAKSFTTKLVNACAGLLLAAGSANAVVVTFDDLPADGGAPVPFGYGGIDWHNHWKYFGDTQPPFTPHSPPSRAFTDLQPESRFTFLTPDQIFNGAWFAGGDAVVAFNLYNDGVLVAFTPPIAPTDVPSFLASGYAGQVDEIGVVSNCAGCYVMDDVTYGARSSVPEPASVALAAAGLVIVELMRRRRT